MNDVINDFVGDAGDANFDEVPPLLMSFEWASDVVTFDGTPKEQRNQLFEQPRRRWFLNWSLLNLAARHKIVELFCRARGRVDDFLYRFRYDYSCTLTECIITAVGGETTTQLIKTYYPGEDESWDEDKKDIMPSGVFAPVVKIDGVTQVEDTNFTLDDTTGIIEWDTSTLPNPVGSLGAGEVVTANYQFYFRVRFGMDMYEDVQRNYEYFEFRGLPLIEVFD